MPDSIDQLASLSACGIICSEADTTPLLRNPTEVRHCSQHADVNVDFGDEGAVDWAFLGNLKQLRALLLG
jgi:hypothetical protein